MPYKYYAHSLPGKPPSEWQPLEEHLKNVAQLAYCFAESFGAGDVAFLAGLLHDLGKFQEEFQRKLVVENDPEAHIENAPGKVDHSTVGALYAKSELGNGKNPFAFAIAYLIAGHHAGLPDWIHEIGSGGALSNRLEKRGLEKHLLEVFPKRLKNLTQPKIGLPGNKPLRDEHLHLWLRMLFSCLVDADFLDTEAFIEPDKAVARAGHADLMVMRCTA
jgi:CRISPR-associated endonuclease/helicase Cas3